jgi:hypothetical protein
LNVGSWSARHLPIVSQTGNAANDQSGARTRRTCIFILSCFFVSEDAMKGIPRRGCNPSGGATPPRVVFSHGARSPVSLNLSSEVDTRVLHLSIGQQPYEGFIVKIDHLNAISPWIAKVAAKRRLQFEFVFLGKFLSHFLELRFIANHDPEMPHVCSLNFVDFENREELMVTQFEESIALTAAHLFEIENVLVKGHRLLNVIHLDRNVIASINLHAHMSA